MRILHVICVAIVALGPVAAAQEPPLPDPASVLNQIGARLLEDLDRLPRYTCIQSITRKYFASPSPGRPSRCASLIGRHDTRKSSGPLESWDRLRLEVGVVEKGNVFSWVGAPRFEEGTLDKLAGRGPLGSGDFGFFLAEVLRRSNMGFLGLETVNGRRFLKFIYDVPVERSGYKIKAGDKWVLTAFSGSFLLDVDNNDIANLTVRTAELPEGANACQANSEVDYGRTPIHESMILVPRETRLNTINFDGSETLSVTTYANCREYAAKSRMLLEGPSSGAATTAKSKSSPAAVLPEGLHLAVRVVTPIDSETAWGGDPVEALLRSPARDKNRHIIAPAGTRLHGRLVRFEQRREPIERFLIELQFDSIEINGSAVPLRMAREHGVNQVFLPFNQARRAVSDPSAGPDTFVFPGEHLSLKHFDSEWITLIPATSVESGDKVP